MGSRSFLYRRGRRVHRWAAGAAEQQGPFACHCTSGRSRPCWRTRAQHAGHSCHRAGRDEAWAAVVHAGRAAAQRQPRMQWLPDIPRQSPRCVAPLRRQPTSVRTRSAAASPSVFRFYALKATCRPPVLAPAPPPITARRTPTRPTAPIGRRRQTLAWDAGRPHAHLQSRRHRVSASSYRGSTAPAPKFRPRPASHRPSAALHGETPPFQPVVFGQCQRLHAAACQCGVPLESGRLRVHGR